MLARPLSRRLVTARLRGNKKDYLSGMILEQRERLGRAMALLGRKTGQAVFFHDYEDAMAGAPVIMIECANDFAAQAAKLAGASRVYPLPQGTETRRSASLQTYYSAGIAGPGPMP